MWRMARALCQEARPAIARHSAARRARAASSVMIVSVTWTRRPRASIDGASSASTASRTKSVARVGVDPGHAEGARLVTERREHPVGRALERLAADDPGHGDDPDAALPGAVERRPDRRRSRGSAQPRRSGSMARSRSPRRRRGRRQPPARRRPDRRRGSAPRGRRAPGAGRRSSPGTRASRRRCGHRSGPGRRSSAGWRPGRRASAGARDRRPSSRHRLAGERSE